jgi:glyoxylase-like metal-dependent hydrolase (beta-lactamase superfamily II)
MDIRRFLVTSLQTNCYVVSDDNGDAFIVDPGEMTHSMLKFIHELKLDPSYIILTHGHGDHTGGIEALKEEFPDIKTVACAKEKRLLYDRNMSFGQGGLSADIWVKDGDTMTVGTMELTFIETPGHTPGGMCVYTPGYLFSGDTLFFDSVGRTDLPGGDWGELERSIREKLYTLPEETRVFPGHMSETNIAYEKRNNPFV